MKLSKFRVTGADSGSEMDIRDPSTGKVWDEGEKATLKLAGKDSKVYQQAAKKVSDKRLKSQGGMLKRMRVTTEELMEDALDLVAAATLGWTGLKDDNDADIPFSPEAARKMYVDYPWLKEQAEEFIDDRFNFMGNS